MQFGYIDTIKNISYKGYIENGEMKFETIGTPLPVKPELDKTWTSSRSSVTAPRWAKFESFLREQSFLYNLELSLSKESGIINIHYLFTLTGEKWAVDACEKDMKEAIDNY